MTALTRFIVAITSLTITIPLLWAIIITLSNIQSPLDPLDPVISLQLLVLNTISTLSSIYLFFQFGRLQQKSLADKIIILMAASDFAFHSRLLISSIAGVSGNNNINQDGTPGCIVFGAIGHFSAVATTSWNFAVALNLYIYFRFQQFFVSMQNLIWIILNAYIWTYAIVSTTLSVVFGWIKLASDGFCWINGPAAFVVLGPVVIYLVFCIFVVSFVSKQIKSPDYANLTIEAKHEIMAKMMAYTVVFISVWGWVIFAEVVQAAIPGYTPYVTLPNGFFISSQGAFNTLIWATSIFKEHSHDEYQLQQK